MDYNPCVLLVFSNCISVIDAKLRVSKEYADAKSPDNFYIHHEYDDNDEVSKLSAMCKASFICDKIKSMTNSIPKYLIFQIVYEEILQLPETATVSFGSEVAEQHIIVNIGSKEPKHSETNTSHSFQALIEKTIKRTCKFLGILISKRLTSTVYVHYVIADSIPNEIFAKILFKAMETHVISNYKATFGFGGSAVFERRRRIVEGNIFQLIRRKILAIVHTFQETYNETTAHLENVCLTLENFKKTCQPSDISACKYCRLVYA